jgi:hypothetical protein
MNFIHISLNIIIWRKVGLSLWTSNQSGIKRKRISFKIILLDVTCHYFDSHFKLQHRTLCVRHLPGSHSSALISEILVEILKDFGITKKLEGIGADNTRNF